METSSPFSPRSPQALAISNLLVVSLIISALVFALVLGLVLYVVVRYRQRPGQGEPRQVSSNTKLEIAWTVAPTVLLAGVFVASFITMRSVDPPANRQPDIIVTGHQWWWQVEYPKSGVVTANEIHVPTGRQLLFQLNAADVIHDFWVPQMGPKRDMIPGKPNYIWLAADKPGVYSGACAEFCGLQHAWMLIRVVAQPPAEFDAWLRQEQTAAAAPAGGDAARGARLFQSMTCANCHAIQGTAAKAQAGPALSHLASRQTLGAGVMQHTPENLAKWITNPQQIKPGAQMPGYNLADADLRALVAYLETLK
jgi:cytochrome c oxidase subunit 2